MKGQNTPAVFHPSSFNLHPFGLPGFPWRVRFHVQRRKPRDQRRNYKTRCGARNKEHFGDFASSAFQSCMRKSWLRFIDQLT
ncbi:MAG: hypothetical protein DMF45_01090 [Verrucomicrobia bacterium]|nr:MAG: hypothetical protein DMF45_01090 [Verrucomicrobiota bacterium]